MFRPILAPLILLISVSFLASACSELAEDDAKAQSTNEKIFPVRITTVLPASTVEDVSIAGTVRYRYETPLGFTTAGKIAAIRVEEGDRVRPGTLLAELDMTSVRSELDSARAEASRADAEFSRFSALFDKGWVTRGQLERTEANALAARARVNAAGFASSTARITAPSAAIVLARTAEPGQVVQPGTQILVLGQADGGLVLRAPATDSDIARMQVGMPASVFLSALPEPIIGSISEIDGRANPGSGAFEVTISLPADPALRSGQIGTATLQLPAGDRARGVAIPASAIFNVRADEGLVYVYDPKTQSVRTRNVSIGPLRNKALMITAGLKVGEQIVVNGLEQLIDGARVKPAGLGPEPAKPKIANAR